MGFSGALWEASKQTPLWRRIGFVLFNVGGFSVASVEPWLDFLTGIHKGYLYLLWFSVLLLLGSGAWIIAKRAWETVDKERAALATKLRPQLELLFDKTCPACCYDYETPRPSFSSRGPMIALRIGIRNTGGEVIDNVNVYLERLEPREAEFVLPAALRPTDQSRPWTNASVSPAKPMRLNPSGDSHHHVNFLFIYPGYTPESRLSIDFATAPFLDDLAANRRYSGVLRAEGDRGQPVFADFTLDEDLRMVFTPQYRASSVRNDA